MPAAVISHSRPYMPAATRVVISPSLAASATWSARARAKSLFVENGFVHARLRTLVSFGPVAADLVFAVDWDAHCVLLAGLPHGRLDGLSDFISDVLSCFVLEFVVDVSDERPVRYPFPSTAG